MSPAGECRGAVAQALPADVTRDARARTSAWYGFGIADRYIATHLIGGTGLVLAVLLALFSIGALFDDLGDVGRGAYAVSDAFGQMLFELPGLCYSLFPLASLIGSLLGLGALASNSELLVLRTSGMSLARQAATVLKVALVLGVVALAIGDWLAPPAERAGAVLRARALQGNSDAGVLLGGGLGLWLRDGRAFVNVRYAKSDTLFGDLQIYEFDAQRRLRVATRAGQAEYVDGAWLLRDVMQSRIDPDPDAGSAGRGEATVERRPGAPSVVSAVRMDEAEWDSGLDPDLLDPAAV
ncbi:MAG: LptF/LptG family permease, partial [Gammaproteobacteria bacterium]